MKANTTFLHSEQDDTVPIQHSQELLKHSGLPESAIVVVANDHRLADQEPLEAMLEGVEEIARKEV